MLSIAARAAVDGALWRPGAQPLAHACSCPRAASQSAFSDRRATFWSHASPFYRRNTSVRSLAQASELPPRAPVGAPATTGRTLLVVESNAKAGKIGKFLGDKYIVIATEGHVRHLPARNGAVDPTDAFRMEWEPIARAVPRMTEIARALQGCDDLILATDPDREGEAISWHVHDVLRASGALGDRPVRRVTFTEVTRDAIVEALRNPREISADLVDAYRARLGLDYLVGFSVSPVLWQKVPGCAGKSAGRVQSVALRLVCEREAQIEAFVPTPFWRVAVDVRTPSGAVLTARVVAADGQKLGAGSSFDSAGAAEAAASALRGALATVTSTRRSQRSRRPPPPFVTSSLLQSAQGALGFSSSFTSTTAQKLYEGTDGTEGLITYPRTDGTNLAASAVDAIREQIASLFSPRHLPAAPTAYKSRAKNAQEAHEAIRPTRPGTLPWAVPETHGLTREQAALYDLVWRRAVACQMAPAQFETATAEMVAGGVTLRVSGTDEMFDGYLAVNRIRPLASQGGEGDGADGAGEGASNAQGTEGGNEGGEGEEWDEGGGSGGGAEVRRLAEGDSLPVVSVRITEHVSSPPPRYNDASLVKAMEELGIGRPSTYASTVAMLERRGYVHPRRGGRAPLVPTTLGRVTTEFLKEFFGQYVEYEFTADMERSLDDVSGGAAAWRDVLGGFWQPFEGAVRGAMGFDRPQVLERLTERLAPQLFLAREDGSDPRACPRCRTGRLELKVLKTGAPFLGCSNFRKKTPKGDQPQKEEQAHAQGTNGVSHDKHPSQALDGGSDEGVPGPGDCNFSLPVLGSGWPEVQRAMAEGRDPGLPRDVGLHSETGYRMVAKNGPYGVYFEMDTPSGLERANCPEAWDPTTATAAQVAELFTLKKGQLLGTHPDRGGSMYLKAGKYGPYVEHEGVMATVPKAWAEAGREVTMEAAVEWVDKKRLRGTGGRGGGRGRGAGGRGQAARGRGRPRAEDPPKASLTQSFDAGDAESGPESGAAPDPLRHIKRPRGAFVFYCLEHGPAVRAATPGISMGDASKRLGEGWKALGAEERAKYEALAHSDSERYASEVASALEAAGPRARAGAGGEKRARGRKAKAKAEADGEVEAGAAKPRRKLSGYLLFTKERRAEVTSRHPGIAPREVMAKLAEMWREASDEEKREYQRRAAAQEP